METPNLSIPEGISDELRVPLEKLIHDFKVSTAFEHFCSRPMTNPGRRHHR
jgi:hypothetical protein